MLEFEGYQINDDEFKLMFSNIEVNEGREIRMGDEKIIEAIYNELNKNMHLSMARCLMPH